MLDEQPIGCANDAKPMCALPCQDGEIAAAEDSGVPFKPDAAVIERAASRPAALHRVKTVIGRVEQLQ